MRYVWQYLQSIDRGGYLNKPIVAPKIDSILPECTIAEIPPDQRCKNYLRLVKKLRRLQICARKCNLACVFCSFHHLCDYDVDLSCGPAVVGT